MNWIDTQDDTLAIYLTSKSKFLWIHIFMRLNINISTIWYEKIHCLNDIDKDWIVKIRRVIIFCFLLSSLTLPILSMCARERVSMMTFALHLFALITTVVNTPNSSSVNQIDIYIHTHNTQSLISNSPCIPFCCNNNKIHFLINECTYVLPFL